MRRPRSRDRFHAVSPRRVLRQQPALHSPPKAKKPRRINDLGFGGVADALRKIGSRPYGCSLSTMQASGLLHDLLQNSPRRLGCSRWGFRASDCSGVLYRPLEGVSGLEPVSSVAEAVASVILPRKQPR